MIGYYLAMAAWVPALVLYPVALVVSTAHLAWSLAPARRQWLTRAPRSLALDERPSRRDRRRIGRVCAALVGIACLSPGIGYVAVWPNLFVVVIAAIAAGHTISGTPDKRVAWAVYVLAAEGVVFSAWTLVAMWHAWDDFPGTRPYLVPASVLVLAGSVGFVVVAYQLSVAGWVERERYVMGLDLWEHADATKR